MERSRRGRCTSEALYRGQMPPSSKSATARGPTNPSQPGDGPAKVSVELEAWLTSDGDKALGGLIEVFGGKSFAILFVLLLGVPALPLPTGGATHVFEIIAALLVSCAVSSLLKCGTMRHGENRTTESGVGAL